MRVQRAWRPELILLLASVLLLLAGNRRFLALALAGRELGDGSAWLFGGALVLAILAINFLLLALFAWGRLFTPVVVLLFVLTAGAAHFIDSFGVFIDPSMLRNALRTHWGEASELIGVRFGLWLLIGAALPAWWLTRLPRMRRSWPRALAERSVAVLLALLALVAALWMAFQPLSSLMRNQRELRYLVTPGNVLWSSASLARQAQREPAGPLLVVGGDASPGPTWAGLKVAGAAAPGAAGRTAARPRVVVLVVGETARAANWGLSASVNHYPRQTTPELATLPVINFSSVTSCGTDTESSLPCMFAAVGRRQYDPQRIRRSENLLHVAARAGVGVFWRDNQSGCKGVCDGFAQDTVAALAPPGLCADGQCLDEGLLVGLEALLRGAPPPTREAGAAGAAAAPAAAKAAAGPAELAGGRARLVVLHQLGNHGPAYYRRVPASFKFYQPACEFDDLRQCDAQSIVNAYDNALRYTDHVLATLIRRLQALASEVDSAVIYVSDHGESLGENGLFLHGMPYAIAPDVQTRVPMVMWVSPGFAAARGLDPKCMAALGGRSDVAHDHLFHTVLGLLDVRTNAREAALDLTHECVRTPVSELARAPG